MGNKTKKHTSKKNLGEYKVSPFLLLLISGGITILTSLLTIYFEGIQEQTNISYEHESELNQDATRTQTYRTYLASIPTSTCTPSPTVTPQAIMDYVIIDKMELIGETYWYPANPGYDEGFFWTISTGKQKEENIALWCPHIPQDGLYQIEVFIPDESKSSDTNLNEYKLTQKALYQLVKINDNQSGSSNYEIEELIKTMPFDQQNNSDGKWHKLSDFTYLYYKDDESPCIKLGDKTGEVPTRIILFDAVKWVYVGN